MIKERFGNHTHRKNKMDTYALEVKDLVKTYKNITAVDGISFTVHPGEVFGLLGPNGAGKTTTLRMLLTLIMPTSGRIRVFGIDTMDNPGKVRQHAGYVPQDVSVDGDLTGYENMLMYAKLYDVPRRTRKQLIQDALEYMELTERARDIVKKYSGGMMRRLEIAQSLVNRPKILYLDEPSIGLDPSARKIIWEHVEKLRMEFGTTVVITTHDMNEADRLCDRIGIMDRGKLVKIGAPLQLKASIGGDIVTLKTLQSNCVPKLKEWGYSVITDLPDGHIELIMADGEKQVPSLLTALHSDGIDVESISIKKPSLDDVFLHFTGTRMEQGDSYASARKTRRTFRRFS